MTNMKVNSKYESYSVFKNPVMIQNLIRFRERYLFIEWIS